MKIGILQLNIIWEDFDKNFERIEKYCVSARANDIRLLLLPEMSFSGFSMNTVKTVCKRETVMEKMIFLSQKYNLFIGFGWVGQDTSKEEFVCNNHYSIVGVNGIVSDYCKIHPFSFSGEDKYFIGGNEITYFNIDGIVFSNFICYDLRFPEIFQIASKKAHVIIVPACWPEKRGEHWKTLLRARAIETQCYILGINCVGEIGSMNYSGDSMIINPDGCILAKIDSVEEKLLFYDLIDDVQIFRENFLVKNDRREDLYIQLDCSK